MTKRLRPHTSFVVTSINFAGNKNLAEGTGVRDDCRWDPVTGTLSLASSRRDLVAMCCTSSRCYRINCHCICHRCRSCGVCAPGSGGAGIGLALGASALGSTFRAITNYRHPPPEVATSDPDHLQFEREHTRPARRSTLLKAATDACSVQ
ncbi:hypothetical protein LSAT2_006813 [Lamellibrachia satsuma]|nr:hypothetical protein LSAT2_006813 [Lamellibrachia satsuma]